MKKMGFLIAVTLLAGCGKPPVDPNIAACPEKVISMIQDNQRFMESIKVGETSSDALRPLKGLKRKATLVRGGDSVRVFFYQTGLPQCQWMMSSESLTPVLVQDGVIIAFGSQTVRGMAAKGWVLKEATWPWQRYDYGYIPIK